MIACGSVFGVLKGAAFVVALTVGGFFLLYLQILYADWCLRHEDQPSGEDEQGAQSVEIGWAVRPADRPEARR